MLLDLKNVDILLGRNHFETEDSYIGNSARRPEGSSYDDLVDHNLNFQSDSGENETSQFAGNGQYSGEIDSSCEMQRLSGELNQRITQEMNGLLFLASL